MAGSPIKNARNRIIRDAILRGLKDGQDPAEYMGEFVDKLKELARAGDLGAIRELFDRIDGKPAQAVTLSGDETAPLSITHTSR